MPSTTEAFYVLREGSTQEELWSWEQIAERCRSGDFGPDTHVYLPDESRWIRVADSELAAELPSPEAVVGETGDGGDDAEDDSERALLAAEYSEAVERVEHGSDGSTGVVEALIEAGCLAADLGELDAARGHFQTALDRSPFHPRVAQEVKRRFAPREWRAFRMLERPPAVWDDFLEPGRFVASRGPLYLAVPAAVAVGLLFVPFGPAAALALAVLWCHVLSGWVSRGRKQLPQWHEILADPVPRLVAPAATLAGVLLEGAILVYAAARLGMLADSGAGVGAFAYVGESPLFIVAITLCAVAYLPAVMVSHGDGVAGAFRILDPRWVVRAVLRMEQEYAMTTLVVLALIFVLAVAGLTAGRVPVLGELVQGVALAVGAPIAGFVLGRLRARTEHAVGLR